MTNFAIITHGSKIGIHASQAPHGVGAIVESAAWRGVPFPVIKSVDNGGTLIEAHRLSPTSHTIWRFVQSELDGIDLDFETDIDWIATRLMDTVLTRSGPAERPATDRFEIANENHPKTPAGWRRLAELQKLMILRLAEHGMKAVIFSLNCGTPEYQEMKIVLDTGVMQVANQHGAWVGFHEGILSAGGVPENADAMWGMGTPIPGSPTLPGAGPFTFRYRFWLNLAREMGIEFPPIVLTEFYPTTQFPLTKLSPEAVADIYARCDAEFSKDPEVIACLPFTIGGPGWENQQHGFAYNALIDYAVSVHMRPNALRGTITTPPPDTERYGIANPILRNLRAWPGGDVVAAAWGGSRWRVLSKAGDYYLVESAVPLWIHASGLRLEP